MIETYVGQPITRTGRISIVSAKVEKAVTSNEEREELRAAASDTVSEISETMHSSCRAAGTIACKDMLKANYTMRSIGVEFSFVCEQQQQGAATEFNPCTLAGETILDPHTAINDAIANNFTATA